MNLKFPQISKPLHLRKLFGISAKPILCRLFWTARLFMHAYFAFRFLLYDRSIGRQGRDSQSAMQVFKGGFEGVVE